MEQWTVAEAKAKLSKVIEQALAGVPQGITRNGREAVVVVSAAEWRHWTARKGTLADFLNASPMRNSGITADRIKGKLREGDLG